MKEQQTNFFIDGEHLGVVCKRCNLVIGYLEGEAITDDNIQECQNIHKDICQMPEVRKEPCKN